MAVTKRRFSAGWQCRGLIAWFRRRELKVSFRTAEPWERPTDWKRNEMPVSSRRAAAGIAELGRILIPKLVREAKRLGLFSCLFWRRRPPKGGQRSLREISAELAQRGSTNERGKPFSAASINSMLR